MTPWDSRLLFAHCCGGQLTVAGETETSAIWLPFKWKYWQGLAKVTAPSPATCPEAHWHCLAEFRSSAVTSNTPYCHQRQARRPFRCGCSQRSRIVSWRVREGEMNELSGHFQSQTPATFSFVLPEKMVIYLPHSSAWAMNVHRNQNSETLHRGVQCSESVVS